MIQTGLIPNAHGDLVTDASYDFYGLRLATCSLDQRYANLCMVEPADRLKLTALLVRYRIKIWQLDENNHWTVEDDWKVRLPCQFSLCFQPSLNVSCARHMMHQFQESVGHTQNLAPSLHPPPSTER